MNPNIERLIEIAESQVGYLEKSKEAYKADPSVLDSFKDGAGSDNYTKYARDLWDVKYFNSSKQGTAWCSTFVSWCFVQAFGKEKALKLQCQPSKGNCGAGCEWVKKYYKGRGRWVTIPSVGSQIVFDSEQGVGQHTGIVVEVGENNITTIEGNTSGGVHTRSYSKTNPKISGYGLPDWSILGDAGDDPGEGEQPMPKMGKIVLPSGATGTTVNVRNAPNGSLVDRLKVGTEVEILQDKGEWMKVHADYVTGWVMSNFVEYDGQDDSVVSPDIDNEVYLRIEAQLKDICESVEVIRDIIGRG